MYEWIKKHLKNFASRVNTSLMAVNPPPPPQKMVLTLLVNK